MNRFGQISSLGFPTLIGTSRKSTIGKLTERPIDERIFGTAATVAYAIAYGVDIVRVHDVEEISDVVKVTDALVRNWRPSNWEE
jgi:dihydropteroate synthase